MFFIHQLKVSIDPILCNVKIFPWNSQGFPTHSPFELIFDLGTYLTFENSFRNLIPITCFLNLDEILF